jgi:hypothetical protein
MDEKFGRCTFLERLSQTKVLMDFTRADGSSFQGIVTRSTLRVNHKPYTDAEWSALDFENMKNRPCGGYRYSYSKQMVTFTAAPKEDL